MQPRTPDLARAASTVQKKGWLATVTRGFTALHVRNFRLYIIGQIISLTGTWMQTTAQAWLVLQLTNSPLALGTVTTLQFLPVMILSLFGGVLADRLPKRNALIITQTLLLIQAAVFCALVASGVIQVWHIYILAVLQGIVTAIDTPIRQAFVVEMVGRDDLPNAVALNSMTFNGARVIGPSVAGIVIAQFGVALALFLNAVSFVAVIIALFMMNTAALFAQAHRTVSGRSYSKQLVEGLSYTWHKPTLLVIIIVVAAIGTFGYNFSVVLPLLGDFVLHTDAAGFGALSSFLGAGSLIAALSTAFVKDVTLRRLLIGAGAFSIILGAVALSTVYAVSAILLMALGASGIVFTTSSNTLLQLSVDDDFRGRVMSLNVLLMMGSTPIGGFLVGFLSDRMGVPLALLICAAFCAAGVIGAIIYQHSAAYTRQTLALDPVRRTD